MEITLRRGIPAEISVLQDLATSDLVNNIVRPIFLTQPSCKSIGIYRNAYTSIRVCGYTQLEDSTRKELVVRLYDADGIKLGLVIDALLQHASGLLEAWVERVKDLNDMVSTGHWQEIIWRIPGAPTLVG
jgi:hypothetical protein